MTWIAFIAGLVIGLAVGSWKNFFQDSKLPTSNQNLPLVVENNDRS
jgi:uncharacterized membrane-anchored protein YhcB (DUF1043 family)